MRIHLLLCVALVTLISCGDSGESAAGDTDVSTDTADSAVADSTAGDSTASDSGVSDAGDSEIADGADSATGDTADTSGTATALPTLVTPTEETPDDGGVIVIGATAIALSDTGSPVVLVRRPNPTDELAMSVRANGVWTTRTVEADADYPAMVVGSTGRPHLLYLRQKDSALRYARWEDGYWLHRTLDRGAATGSQRPFFDIALDASDDPHVVWYDPQEDDLVYGHWTGTSFATEVVEADGNVGKYARLSVAGDGTVHAVYWSVEGQAVRYAVGRAGDFTISTVPTPGISIGEPEPDVAVDGAGTVTVAYAASDGLHRARLVAGSWDDALVAEGRMRTVLLEVDQAGRAHFAYRCSGATCRREPCSGVCSDPPPTIFYARESDGQFEEFTVAENAGAVSMVLDPETHAPHFSYATAIGFGGGTFQYADFGVPTTRFEAVSGTVGAAGGSLASDDGALTLDVPAGALAADTMITMRRVPRSEWGTALAEAEPVGAVVELLPEGQTFSEPVVASVRQGFEDLFAIVDEDGLRSGLVVRLESADGTVEEVPSIAPPLAASGRLQSAELSHFTRLSWEEDVGYRWGTRFYPHLYHVMIGQAYFQRHEIVWTALPTGMFKIETFWTEGFAEEFDPLTSEISEEVSLGDRRMLRTFMVENAAPTQFAISWRCIDLGSNFGRTFLVLEEDPPEGLFRDSEGRCGNQPTCGAVSDPEDIAVALGDILSQTRTEPLTECPGLEVDVDKSPAPHGEIAPPAMPGQGDHTELAFYGSYTDSFSADTLAGLWNGYPCTAGSPTADIYTLTLCGAETPPPAGDYVVSYGVLKAPIPLADPDTFFNSSFYFDGDGIPDNNQVAPPSAPNDTTQGTDLWVQASHSPGGNWALDVVDNSSGTPVPVTSDTRLIISGNTFVAFIPASLFGVANPGVRVAVFRYAENFGRTPPYDWSGDHQPRVGKPLLVTAQ